MLFILMMAIILLKQYDEDLHRYSGTLNRWRFSLYKLNFKAVN